MREIKFRYVLRHIRTEDISSSIFSIGQLEQNVVMFPMHQIIAREIIFWEEPNE